MGVFENFPYTNFHELNLDWIIEEVKKVREEWDAYREETSAELAEFRAWFDNLDVQDEVRVVVQEMVSSGQFLTITLPSITSVTESWLSQHITQETGYVIDDTLTVAGAAADAKAAGEININLKKIAEPEYNIFDSDTLLNASNWTKSNDNIYSGIIGNLTDLYSISGSGLKFEYSNFEENTQYAISFTAYNDDAEGSGNTFSLDVGFTDGTAQRAIYAANSWHSWTSRVVLTTPNKTISKIGFQIVSQRNSTWHFKDFIIAKCSDISGLPITAQFPYKHYKLSGIDYIARKTADSFFIRYPVKYVRGDKYYVVGDTLRYTRNANRISLSDPIYLEIKDIIALSDYTDARMYISWVNNDNIIHTTGWRTTDFTVYESGYYTVVVSNLNDTFVEDAATLGNLLDIKHKASATELIKIVGSDYDLNTVPDYYTNFDNKVIATREDIANAGYTGATFIFSTDNHIENNNNVSPTLIKNAASKLNIDTLILGGDLIDGGVYAPEKSIALNTLADAFNKYNITKNVFFVNGNHDSNTVGQTSQTERHLSNKNIYGICMRQMENKNVVFGNFDTLLRMPYYWDIPETKTRIVVADTGLEGVSIYDSQLNWLTNAFETTPANYHIILLAHIWCESGSDEYGLQFSTQGQQLINIADAFNATSNTTKIVGMFGGHVHKDAQYVTPGGINLILTDCDSLETLSGVPAIPGTATESCFDIITINYTSKTINCRRFGRGNDRTFTYDY